VPGSSINVASTRNGYLFIPGNGMANAQRMSVRAGGTFAIGNDAPTASPAVTIAAYPVTWPAGNPSASNPSSSLADNAVIGTTAIVSQQLATSNIKLATGLPWALLFDLEGDSSSGLVQLLSGNIIMDGTAGTVTAGLVSGLSAINFSLPVPFGIVFGVTFSVSDPLATASLYQADLSL
jgi:hypothetical protein